MILLLSSEWNDDSNIIMMFNVYNILSSVGKKKLYDYLVIKYFEKEFCVFSPLLVAGRSIYYN